MLTDLFMKVLDMTKAGSIVILLVILARFLLKKAPKVFSYTLWAVVLFRLLCPVSIEAPTSILPEITPVSDSYTLSEVPISPVNAGVAAYHAVGDAINGGLGIQHIRTELPDEYGGAAYVSSMWWEVWILFGQYVWLIGLAVMAVYAAISYIRVRRKLVTASPLRKNIFLADEITSPFVMGLIRPKIYLPSSMDEQEQSYILLHEQHHIQRLDHIFKALGFLALCIHWFNPLVWIAFILAGKDMEMSCDEAVVKKMGEDIRADYTASLLSLATGKRIIAGTPLAFGEGDTKGRIHNLANWKKPTIWIILIAVLACAVFAVTLLTNPMHRQTIVMGANYDIEETLYPQDSANEDSLETPLQYCVTADYHLYAKYEEDGDWILLGKLEPYTLTKQELLSYLPNEKLGSYRLSEITDSYILRVENQYFYMVMQTKSGDTLLTYGWEDVSERWDGGSDDTSLRQVHLLKSTFREGYVNGSFFMRTLRTVIGENVYAFASFESDRIPGYHIEGFKCGDSSDHTEMTNMGFAVFQTTGTGYRLIDCKVYEGAVNAENGVYFCPDPAIADVNGELRNDNSFDVILICNENVGKIERVYHADGKDDYSIADSNINTHSMFLFSWDIGREYESMSQYIYDKDGNLLTAEVSLPANSASWDNLPGAIPNEAVEWFDYYHNDNMQWDGRQEITLDAFPDVTFRWYSEKVEALVGEKATPLYTGMPIWNVFFVDLTGDGLPELCSTLSMGSGLIDERIIIYDYANRVSYSLEDRGNYDFSLSLRNGRIMVTKCDHRSREIVDQGYLAYQDETVTIVKAAANVTELIPGTTYVPYQCIYLNPLSSYFAFGGDSGYTYTVWEDYFETVHRESGAQNLIEVQNWEWKKFPYTDEEWASFYVPSIDGIPDISGRFDQIKYLPLSAGKFLMLVDGDIWIVELSSNSQMGTYLWSIYSLVPESAMGVAQWESAPILSSRSPVFTFQFDMDYTEISAICTNGVLTEFNYGDESDIQLTVPAGESLHWAPISEGLPLSGETIVRFSIVDGDNVPYHGTLYITSSEENTNGRRLYTARLVGTGLHLSQNPNAEGGIITLIGGSMPAPEEIAYDLGAGDLKIPASELGNYIFYTNSTKLTVEVEGEKGLVGTVRILDSTQNDVVCGTHEVSNRSKKVTFSNLISISRYRVTWDGPEDCIVTVSD